MATSEFRLRLTGQSGTSRPLKWERVMKMAARKPTARTTAMASSFYAPRAPRIETRPERRCVSPLVRTGPVGWVGVLCPGSCWVSWYCTGVLLPSRFVAAVVGSILAVNLARVGFKLRIRDKVLSRGTSWNKS